MNLKKAVTFLLIFFFLCNLFASENTSGFIRLTLNEKQGTFSLYYLIDPDNRKYEPLINNNEPSASFLEVLINGRPYRPGQSKGFKTSVDKINGNPAIIYESSLLTITQIFIPVKTTSSRHANGINISITIENTGSKTIDVGLRVLIDTYLGESIGNTPIITNERIIANETIISKDQNDKFWVSSGQNVALMGSIINPVNPNETSADYIHIANWKRLNDTYWKLKFLEGRSFSYPPYSIRDSAICYYYEPEPFQLGDSKTYNIFLTTEDAAWYNRPLIPAVPQVSSPEPELFYDPVMPQEDIPVVILEPQDDPLLEQLLPVIPEIPEVTEMENPQMEEPLEVIYEEPQTDEKWLNMLEMQQLLDKFIAGEILLSEQELLDIERAITDYQSGL